MEFIEAPAFTRHLHDYLSDEDYRKMQVSLFANPEAGEVIRGTGGFRKLRWVDTRRGKGKRGGLRVIYYYFSGDQQIWLLTVYDKNEKADLSLEQQRALKAAIENEKRGRAKVRKK